MIAIRLRTEYLKDPIGIDIQLPRLMWNCADGVTQTAYRIVTEAWDSDKEKAGKLSQILYVLAEMTAGMDVEDPNRFAEQVAELF